MPKKEIQTFRVGLVEFEKEITTFSGSAAEIAAGLHELTELPPDPVIVAEYSEYWARQAFAKCGFHSDQSGFWHRNAAGEIVAGRGQNRIPDRELWKHSGRPDDGLLRLASELSNQAFWLRKALDRTTQDAAHVPPDRREALKAAAWAECIHRAFDCGQGAQRLHRFLDRPEKDRTVDQLAGIGIRSEDAQARGRVKGTTKAAEGAKARLIERLADDLRARNPAMKEASMAVLIGENVEASDRHIRRVLARCRKTGQA
jgi:hypothetical protein